MAEFTLETQPIEDTNMGTIEKNIKELKIGNGRWKVDPEALRMKDASGNTIIYLGED